MLLCAFAVFVASTGMAQQSPDSLEKVLISARGEERFKALKALGKFYQQRDPAKSLKYASQQRDVARDLKNHKLLAEALADMSIPLALMQQNTQAILLLQERQYYQNKQIRMEGSFKEDERDGKWVYYFENGNIWSEGSFREGKSDGKRITYYENGNKRYEGEYLEGTKTGLWYFYDEQGRKVKEVDYSKESQKEVPDDNISAD